MYTVTIKDESQGINETFENVLGVFGVVNVDKDRVCEIAYGAMQEYDVMVMSLGLVTLAQKLMTGELETK